MPELQFKGKEFVYNHHLSVPYRPLVPDASKSVGEASLNGNLIIHGDNLHALKALLPMYAGKVDCIFIDPPYNTGNEGWSYNDNVNSPMMKEWLSTNPVNAEDMLRHDKWCAMMWPRLTLLRELLSDSGSIWITLDDNEISNARGMLDEIFGASNFVACIAWEKRYTRSNNANRFYSLKDYVLAFRKTDLVSSIKELRNEKSDQSYDNPDKDPRGPWMTSSYINPATKERRKKLVYSIDNPFTGARVEHPTHAWKYKQTEHKKHVQEKRLWWGQNGEAEYPRLKLFLSEMGDLVPVDLWDYKTTGTTDEGGTEIKQIFGFAAFDTPKPRRLIEKILRMVPNDDALVLDSFAGSGTTAHAVLALNQEDEGNRHFILVEGEAYADTVTAERVRRVMNGYEFQGTQKEELLRESLTWTKLKNADGLLSKVAEVEDSHVTRFASINKTVKDGELVVTGENKVTERTEGLGGEFTYCTLGPELNLDRILTGEQLPDYLSVGAWLFHTATGEVFDPAKAKQKNWYLGESAAYYLWLLYRPELDFLKSAEAALTMALAEKIAKAKPAGKKHLVFAPAKYVPNSKLLPMGVEYAPLPFALYRIEKG
jgi:adenine-specific DNA-methyltransferase